MHGLEFLKSLNGIHSKIAEDAGIKEVRVVCTMCGNKKIVNGGDCLAKGWPKCCGTTMRLVEP